jgi:nucleosome binding factor SPN SPT16 subunit
LQNQGQGHLVAKLAKNIGSVIGLELRDSTNLLTANNERKVQPGMTFNITLNVSDLRREDAEDEAGKKYAIIIADTVVVKPDGPAEVVTAASAKDWDNVAYQLGEVGPS